MIDRLARDAAVNLIRQYFGGSITNDELLDEFPRSSPDSALEGIYQRMFDLVDDLYGHKVLGSLANDPVNYVLVQRCVLFLHSDLEYQWVGKSRGIINRLRGLRSVSDKGEAGVWPFFRRVDYETVSKTWHVLNS
jgi:hypothetical protein